MDLSVVLPTLNEGARLGQTLEEIHPFLCEHFPNHEILIVDDVSHDNTVEIAIAFAKRTGANLRVLVQSEWLGKGASVKRGCLEAKGNYVLYMDADHAVPIQEVIAFKAVLDQGTDLVAGIRRRKNDETFARRMIAQACLLLAHLIVFREKVPDSQCGFKLFTRKSAQMIFPLTQVNGGMIDVEILHLIHHLKLKVKFLSVSWNNKPGSRINVKRCLITDPFELLRIRGRRYLSGAF